MLPLHLEISTPTPVATTRVEDERQESSSFRTREKSTEIERGGDKTENLAERRGW